MSFLLAVDSNKTNLCAERWELYDCKDNVLRPPKWLSLAIIYCRMTVKSLHRRCGEPKKFRFQIWAGGCSMYEEGLRFLDCSQAGKPG